ncbi:3'(2'),5'-bisphosphate nucleotidase CysQ [Prochlorococcus sp. MIT 1223]|uniref:3'(2'),5'-bisphosphate nucleotidase CysQ n=1 Tax=Prochlorococcus sp. MIT 1223 TaxID=3096217 RepID=UPI0039C44D3E
MLPVELSLPNDVDLKNLLEKLRELSWGCADILMAYARGEKPPYGFSQSLNVQDNEDGPVSAADLAVNNWLLKGFESTYPFVNWEILSEETYKSKSTNNDLLDKEWVWILDPLDGTKDFLLGTGEYAVHLALTHHQEVVLGVVLIPELEELWFGVIGHSAWYENRLGQKKYPSFSHNSELDEMVLVASRSHRDKRLEALIDGMKIGQQKSVGSIGCKIATILKGESDIYVSLSGQTAPKDWDLAAPAAILIAAGGMFTHADGKPLIYNTGDISQRGCLIATNGIKHDVICKQAIKIMDNIDPGFLT